MFGNLGQLTALIRNAQKMRESMAETLGQVDAEGLARGGDVSVRANGRFEIVSVRIDPRLLAEGDAELLEDLIVAATNQALQKAKQEAAQSLGNLTGGMPIPGLGDLLGTAGTPAQSEDSKDPSPASPTDPRGS